MKIKWILICLLVAVGITGCKDKEEPTPLSIDYYDGIWVANSSSDTTATPDCLLFVEGEEYVYATIDWGALCICPCEDNAVEQYKNLSFTYCAPLIDGIPQFTSNFQFDFDKLIQFLTLVEGGATFVFIIKGIVNNNLGLYKNALQVKKLSKELQKSLEDFEGNLSKMYKQLKNNLNTLELSVKSVDSVRVISLRQNRLAYYRKCNDDLVNEQQIVYSRSVAYFNTINELLNIPIGKTREDTLNFYRRLDPIVSEWAGEGGIYIDDVKNLMDKMVTTYSVSSLGQSTYDVGMPSIYSNLAQWTFPDQKDKDKRSQLYQTLLARDWNKMYFAYYLTDIYCQTKMSLYGSIEAETSFNEFRALKDKLMKCYSIKKQQ